MTSCGSTSCTEVVEAGSVTSNSLVYFWEDELCCLKGVCHKESSPESIEALNQPGKQMESDRKVRTPQHGTVACAAQASKSLHTPYRLSHAPYTR